MSEHRIDNVTFRAGGTVANNGETVAVEFEYARQSARRFVLISIMDVRAADDIRVSFDFDRDGWKIEQASKFEWTLEEHNAGDDEHWVEVAFVEAWGSDPRGGEYA